MTIFSQKGIQTAIVFHRSGIRPVQLLDVAHDVRNDLLIGLAPVFEMERCSQHRVAVDDALPSGLEARQVDRFVQRADHLLHIDAGTRIAQAVHQHALLSWRQRVPRVHGDIVQHGQAWTGVDLWK